MPDLIILEEEVIQDIMEGNLAECINDYFRAMKKAIVDYVLLD
jgi:hypothetical protein